MILVDKHSSANLQHESTNVTFASNQSYNDVTTQMMMSGDPPFKNHSKILVWTDHEDKDIFSLVLKKRIAHLRENSCPVLNECSFSFTKRGNDADTVVVAAKRHFPYGGKESGKTWTLIIPGHESLLSNSFQNNVNEGFLFILLQFTLRNTFYCF